MVLAILLTVLATGCQSREAAAGGTEPTALPTAATVAPSGAGADDPQGHGAISATQKTAVSDGVVTYDEYQAGFQRLVSCVEGDGFELVPRPEVNQVLGASYPDAAADSYERCYWSEFGVLDQTWQIWRENFGPDAQAMAECLIEKGKTPGATLKERYEALVALGIDPYKDCVDVKNNAG